VAAADLDTLQSLVDKNLLRRGHEQQRPWLERLDAELDNVRVEAVLYQLGRLACAVSTLDT